MRNYLLDTNLLVAIVRSDLFADNFKQHYSLESDCMISVVIQGELQSLAIQWKWGSTKIQRLDSLLKTLLVLPIKTQSVINSYAQIDAYSQGKLPSRPLPQGMTARNMGKNDLWIAATAHATQATLLTTDHDFDHLGGVFFPMERIGIGEYL